MDKENIDKLISEFMRGKLPSYAEYLITEDIYGYRDEHTRLRYTVTIYIDINKMKKSPRVHKSNKINCDRLFNDMRILCKKNIPKLIVAFTIKRL